MARKINPDMRAIAILRDPVQRAFSSYRFNRFNGGFGSMRFTNPNFSPGMRNVASVDATR